MALKVGQTVLLHKKNNPVTVLKRLWKECDMKKVDIQDLWISLKIMGKYGVIKAIYDKDIYIDFNSEGIWCLSENMLEEVK